MLAFATGLTLDALSNGPLGYWALVALAMAEVAIVTADMAREGLMAHTLSLIASLSVGAAVQWALVLAFTHQPPDTAGLARATIAAALAYPLLATVLHALTLPMPARSRLGSAGP